MIQLTRLNGRPFVLNAELIKTIEATPDTMISLLHGEQLVVREEPAEVVRRAVAYARSLRTFQVEPLPTAPPPGDTGL
jgi:flagellar protein FlbD